MNIFYTSNCPKESAKYLDNKRVVKMCLETAQLLSTALRVNGYNGDLAYKITHKNHPSTKWVCSSRSNFEWLVEHFKALCFEYTDRYGKIHKSSRLLGIFQCCKHLIPDSGFTSPPNCAANKDKGISYKHIANTEIAYQMYLNDRWESDSREPKWG